MQRFRFRLERVLHLKRQKDRLAEIRQRQAQSACETALREVERLLEGMAQSARAVEQRVGRALATDCWVAHCQHLAQLRLAIDAAERDARQARAALEEANRVRRTSATELEALTLLRRDQWRAHRQEASRIEQTRLDDRYGRGADPRQLAAQTQVLNSATDVQGVMP